MNSFIQLTNENNHENEDHNQSSSQILRIIKNNYRIIDAFPDSWKTVMKIILFILIILVFIFGGIAAFELSNGCVYMYCNDATSTLTYCPIFPNSKDPCINSLPLPVSYE